MTGGEATYLFLIKILFWIPIKILLIILLVLIWRPSLALYLWAGRNRRSKVRNFIARRVGASPAMYRGDRWREVRKIVYARNKSIAAQKLGTDRYFLCEATGFYSDDLKDFHVDHIMPRGLWPLLAYDPKNLRLVRAQYNVQKSDRVYGLKLIKFILLKRIR